MAKEKLEKYGNSYGEQFRQYEERIAELEKENAELKAHLLQWHDLRKNPYDLPSENKEYIVAYIGAKGSDCADKICSSEEYFDAEVMRWRNRDTFEDLPYLNNNDNIVLAWCEIPKFEE